MDKKRAVVVLIIVWMAFLFTYLVKMAWPPMIPVASKSLGLSALQAGAFMTSFYIGYVITQVPAGLLADRFGYRKIIIISLLFMGIFGGLTGGIQHFYQGITLRLFAGLSCGAIYSASVLAIFEWFPVKGRATAMGFFMTATSLGITLVNLIVPTMAKQNGWRFALYSSGILPIVGSLLAFLLLKENPAKQLQKKENSSQPSTFWTDIAQLFKNRNFILIGIAGFFAMSSTWGIPVWANTYVNKGLGLSLIQAGLIMSLYGIAALICKPLVGMISDIIGGRRKMVMFWALVFFGPMALWFGANQSISMLYFLAPALGIFAFVYSPIMITFTGELVEERQVGMASGLVNAIWQLGSAFSPMVVGAVLDTMHSYFYAFVTLAVGPIIAAVLILFVREQKPAEKY